jgi:hypothetical protein
LKPTMATAARIRVETSLLICGFFPLIETEWWPEGWNNARDGRQPWLDEHPIGFDGQPTAYRPDVSSHRA